MKVPKGMVSEVLGLQANILEKERINKEGKCRDSSRKEPEEAHEETHDTVAYRRVESCTDREARDDAGLVHGDLDAELGEVDMESVQYHCEATIMVPNSRGQEPMKVGAVLEVDPVCHVCRRNWQQNWGPTLMGPKLCTP